ncbi:MAG: preprotein translocase subunit YajC [Micromonosporaceae bacterium]|nr:preprotein translocase subunit YajC [Micromonosporaceae bacterium]
MPIAASSTGSSALPLLFIILIFAAMYFLMIRPQQRRNREVQRMQSTLGPGDEVMTSSGIYGEVLDIDETEGTVTLEIAPEVSIKIARGAVAKVVTSAAQEAGETGAAAEAETSVDDLTDATPEANRVIERRKD